LLLSVVATTVLFSASFISFHFS